MRGTNFLNAEKKKKSVINRQPLDQENVVFIKGKKKLFQTKGDMIKNKMLGIMAKDNSKK